MSAPRVRIVSGGTGVQTRVWIDGKEMDNVVAAGFRIDGLYSFSQAVITFENVDLDLSIANPKPDEPQGLGAVVEDDEGVLFVRTNVGGWEWHEADGPPTSWNMIAAVKVLSEGVTA